MMRTHEWDDDTFDFTMKVNLKGVFWCMRAELNQMLQQIEDEGESTGYSIINTSSIAGLTAMKFNCAYAASKHAVVGLSKAAAMEYSTKNIRINTVNPGFVRTPMTDILDEQKLVRYIPWKRFGEVSEVAMLMLFLASNASSYITGQSMIIDGGLTSKL
eukprot:TRINITY_DN3081_c0_g2_i1.p4 TRINITY_DN3081_c0_g2~~TRINITY_DN3081_c0_g2_i1.p4  ORF type:complete len:159 (+),score=64.47 TRINITY_DN3081_c0_g2_i1:1836-2312(+)